MPSFGQDTAGKYNLVNSLTHVNLNKGPKHFMLRRFMKVDIEVEKVIEKLIKSDFEAAIVGGAVRDLLVGKEVSDWDLATNALPEEILKLFPGSFYNNVFGTVGLALSDKSVLQITTYRSEEKYTDKRHPDVISWGKTLEEDLSRRDFTINAMALKPKAPLLEISNLESQISNFQLVDLFGGEKDLKAKIIRTVGDPNERFNEDALRIMRAVRFATTLDFKIEEKTFEAIKKHSMSLSEISGERIRDELLKIISDKNADLGILLLRDTGILEIIIPELADCFDVEQKSPKRHHVFDVGTHCVLSLKFCPSDDTITRFAALLHDIGKAKVAAVTEEGVRTFYNHEVIGGRQAREITQRLHLSKGEREKLYKLVRFHQFSVNENQTDKALRRFIKNIGIENIEDMMALRIGDRLGGGLQQPESWRLKLFRERLKEVLKKPFTVADLKISGYDVMRGLGIGPGKKVGEILNALFEEVFEEKEKNDRKKLLEKLEDFKN